MKNNNKQNTEKTTNRAARVSKRFPTNTGEPESKPRLVLPLMKSIEDAKQLCHIEQDNVYLSIFMIQCWLGHATLAIGAEYAEKKDPRTRKMQSGQSWRSFMGTLGHAFRSSRGNEALTKPATVTVESDSNITPNDLDESSLADFFSHIIRFTEFEDPMADLLREALARLWIETDGDFSLNSQPSTLNRLCDWLDSVFHSAHHMMWHVAPEQYDPDPEKRELAMLGRIQRHFDIATDVEKAHWQWHYSDAIKQYADSPKLSALAAGLSSTATRTWNYPDVDAAIITVWPLVKRHNWTYADLLETIRPKLKRPEAYPCDTEQNFATYCNNVIGLRKNVCLPAEALREGGRKTGKGQSSSGELLGAEIARRLLALPA